MSRKERFVHHIALIALIANLFAPLFAMENVFAQDPLAGQESTPTAEFDTTSADQAAADQAAADQAAADQAAADQAAADQAAADQAAADQAAADQAAADQAAADQAAADQAAADQAAADQAAADQAAADQAAADQAAADQAAADQAAADQAAADQAAADPDGDGVIGDLDLCPDAGFTTDADGDGCEDPVVQEPVITKIAPQDLQQLVISEATCVDPAISPLTFPGMPSNTDQFQIEYKLIDLYGTGTYSLTAKILIPDTAWQDDGSVIGWSTNGDFPGLLIWNTQLQTCPPPPTPEPAPEVVLLAPADVLIGEATCVNPETLTFDGMPTSTDSIAYTLTGPDADGKYTLTATLVGDTAWNADGVFADWTVDATTNVASYNTLIDPCPADKDGDKILDDVDNCPDIANEDQADADEDGKGDACDDVDDREMSIESRIRAIDEDGNEVTEAIPGATIVFEITITNTGETDVDNLVIDPSLELQELSCVDGEGNTVELVDALAPEKSIVCTGTYEVPEVGEVDAEANTQVGPQMRTMSAESDTNSDTEGEKGEDVKLEIKVQGLSVPADNSIAPAVQIMTTAGITLPGGVTPYTNSNYQVDFAGYNCVGGANGKYADCVVSVDPGRYHQSGSNSSQAYACKINNNSGASWTTSGSPRVYSGGTWSGVLGAPDGTNDTNPDGSEPSIGWGGIIVVQFTDNRLIADGSTATKDLKIWERGSEPEPSNIYVSNNGTNWILVGTLSGTQNNQIQEFNIDGVGGIQAGDIFQYVMIVDLDQKSYAPCGNTFNRAGADIDSVEALSSVLHPVAPTVIAQECKNGATTNPSVTFASSPVGVSYSWDSGSAPSMTPGTTFKVRATITATTAIWPNNLGDGWVRVSDKVATWQHKFASNPCTGTTMPTITPVQAVCTGSTAGTSSVSVTTIGNGITSSVSPTSAPGGTNQNFEVTLTLAKGYKWPAEVTSANGWTIANSTQTGISTAKKTYTMPAKICAFPDVTIVKTASPTYQVVAGEEVTFTLEVRNIGTGSATNVTVSDTLKPAGLNWDFVGTAPAGCSITGGVLTCTIATMAPNPAPANAMVIKVKGTIISSLTCGSYTNTATVSAGNEATTQAANGNSSSAVVDIACDIDKLTYCHSTSSTGNPFNLNTTSISSVVNSHYPGHSGRMDVIPGFTYNTTSYPAIGNQNLLGLVPPCIVPIPVAPIPSATCTPDIGYKVTLDKRYPELFHYEEVWDGLKVTVTLTPIGNFYLTNTPALWAGWTISNVTVGGVATQKATYTHTFSVVPCPAELPSLPNPDPAVCTDVTFPANSVIHVPVGSASGVKVVSVAQGGTTATASSSVDANGFGDYTVPNTYSGQMTVTIELLANKAWPTQMAGWTVNPGNNQQATKKVTVTPVPCVAAPPAITLSTAVCIDPGTAVQSIDFGAGTGVVINSVKIGAVTDTTASFDATNVPGGTVVVMTLSLKSNSFVWPALNDMTKPVAGGVWTEGANSTRVFTFTTPNDKDCQATLSVTKTAGSSTIIAGQSASFTITVKNTHTANTAYDVVLKDVVPTGYVWAVTNVTGANASICNALTNGQGELKCTIDTLAPGASVSVTITAPTTINPSTCPATIKNALALAAASNAVQATAGPVSISVLCVAADFPIYSTTVSSCVNGAPTDPLFSLGISNGMTAVVTDNGEIITGVDRSNEQPPYTLFTLTGGGNHVVQVTLTLEPGYAWPDGTTQSGSFWTVDNNTATLKKSVEIATKVCDPVLSIDKSQNGTEVEGVATYQPGDTITFTVTISNSGEGTAKNVTFTDTLPVAMKSLTWGYDEALCDLDSIAGTITCSDFAVPHGTTASPGTKVFTFSVTVPDDGSVCGPQTNSVSDPTILTPIRPTGMSPFTVSGDSANFTINCQPALDVTKGVRIGETGEFSGTVAIDTAPTTVQYQVTVANTGNTTLTDVPFADTLSNANGTLTLMSVVPAGAITWDAGSTTEGTIDSIANGTNVKVTYSYVVSQNDLDSSTAIQNCAVATVSSTVKDNDCANVTKTQTPAIDVTKGVRIGETGEFSGTVAIDTAPTTVQYQVTVANTGNTTLTNVPFADTLSNANGTLTLVSVSPVDAITWTGTSTTEGTIGSIAKGSSVVVTYSYVVSQNDLDSSTAIQNCAVATVSSTVKDSDCANVTKTQTPAIDVTKGVRIGETGEFSGTVAIDTAPTTVQYQVTVANEGNVTLEDVAFDDTLTDANGTLTLMSVVPAGAITWDTGSTTEGTIGSIANGTSVVVTYSYVVSQNDLDSSTAIQNCVNASESDNVADEDCVTVTKTQTPHITFSKSTDDSSVSPGIDVLATVSFEIEVLNDGNVTLTSATITDTDLAALLPTGDAWSISVTEGGGYLNQTSAFPFEVTDLPPTGKIVITASLTVPAGIELPNAEWCKSFDNTANITGTYANDAVVVPDSQILTAIDPPAGISSSASVLVNCTGLDIQKSVTFGETTAYTGSFEPGDEFSYVLTVKNNGNTDVYSISVTDTLLDTLIFDPADVVISGAGNSCDPASAITCSIPTLAQNGSVTITIPVQVAPVGTITTAQCDAGLSNTAQIDKTFSLTNSNQPSSMSRGITPPDKNDIPSNTVTNAIVCDSDFTLVKTSSVATTTVGDPGRVDKGDIITYTFVVTNTGDVTLYNVVITDPMTGLHWDSTNTIAELKPGVANKVTLTATHVVTQPDLDAGEVLNCADATGRTISDDAESSVDTSSDEEDRCTTTDLPQEPDVEVVKTGTVKTDVAGDPGRIDKDDIITYTFEVTNTGNVTLYNINVSDLDLPVVFQTGTTIPVLPPGAANKVTLTATYVVTQANLNAGEVLNCAEAVGTGPVTETNPNGEEAEATNDGRCTTTELPQEPGIEVVKTGTVKTDVAGEPDRVDKDDIITYTFVVTNTGNVTLYNVNVSDLDLPVVFDDSTTIDELNPGVANQVTLTATYVVTQANLNAGEVLNCAEAVGTGPVTETNGDGEETEATNDGRCTTTELPQEPGIEVVKTGTVKTDVAGEPDRVDKDDIIEYTFVVTNTGNVTLYNVNVSDLDLPVVFDGSTTIDELNPGVANQVTLTATYVVTQANLNAGEVLNCAEAMGTGPATETNPNGEDTEATNDGRCTTTELPQEPGIVVDKEASIINMAVKGPEDRVDAGDVITYTFVVTNTGNVTLTDIELSDDLIGAGNWGVDGNTIASLDPGISAERTATYTVLQSDIDADFIENCVDLSAQPPVQEQELTASLVVNPFVDETAPANWPPMGDCVTVDDLGKPGVEIEKSEELLPGDDGVMDKDDVIRYTFVVTNTGNTTLNNVVVTDPLEDLEWESETTIATLAPGESVTLTATYKVPQAMIDTGLVENCAIVNADGPEIDVIVPQFAALQSNDEVEAYATDEDCIETPLESVPAIAILKTGTEATGDDDTLDVDEVITYTFTVTNTGNVTVSNIEIADPMPNLIWSDGGNTIATLAPGMSADVTATYVVTQADLDNGTVENCAEATGMAPDETEVASNESCEIMEMPQEPAISILKNGAVVSNSEGILDLGEVITYTFTITNTGNVTLTNVTVIDVMEGLVWGEDANIIATLAPGATVTVSATFTITQASMDDGLILNCADITSEAPNGSAVRGERSCDTKVIEQNLLMGVVQECPGPLSPFNPEMDQLAEFTITVTNTGNVTLINVHGEASREGSLNEPFSTTFAPGQSETRIWTTVMTAEDFANLEVRVEFWITGETEAGFSTMLASSAMMQSVGGNVSGTITLDCPISETTVPHQPVTPVLQKPVAPVGKLPDTGVGSVTGTATILWAAAMMSIATLGAGALGLRKRYDR